MTKRERPADGGIRWRGDLGAFECLGCKELIATCRPVANNPEQLAARRELLEETGYLAGRLKPIGVYFTSPGILSEKMYAYAAYDLRKQEMALEEGEEIEVEPTALDEALRMIGDGRIQDGKTIATLLMYDGYYKPQK